MEEPEAQRPRDIRFVKGAERKEDLAGTDERGETKEKVSSLSGKAVF